MIEPKIHHVPAFRKSAAELLVGIVLLVVSQAWLLFAVTAYAQDRADGIGGSGGAVFVGVLIGVVGLFVTLSGVHALATNVDETHAFARATLQKVLDVDEVRVGSQPPS